MLTSHQKYAITFDRHLQNPYLCNVFFMVLDLRLTRIGCRDDNQFFFAYTQPGQACRQQRLRYPFSQMYRINKCWFYDKLLILHVGQPLAEDAVFAVDKGCNSIIKATRIHGESALSALSARESCWGVSRRERRHFACNEGMAQKREACVKMPWGVLTQASPFWL